MNKNQEKRLRKWARICCEIRRGWAYKAIGQRYDMSENQVRRFGKLWGMKPGGQRSLGFWLRG